MRARTCALLALLAPACARAQQVFIDEFDGPTLAPHWNSPAPAAWTHSFSAGMLHVEGLHNQATQFFSFTRMGAAFATVNDLWIDIRMGWDAGPSRDLIATIAGAVGPVGAFGYLEAASPLAPEPAFFIALAGSPMVFVPPPAPGLHTFTLRRVSASFELLIDNQLVHATTGPTAPASSIALEFHGPTGTFPPLHLDRVAVIPAPASALLAPAFLGLRRRRPVAAACPTRGRTGP